jgi:hypothetical protein
MVASVLEQCGACIATLKTIVSNLSQPDRQKGRVHHEQVNDELGRFSLWMGNIGALHRPESFMSLESRLREANDVLTHILELLNDLNEVAGERGFCCFIHAYDPLTWPSLGDCLRRARRGDSFCTS